MKRVLIITYYWPPSGGAGVQRWLKFTKYLRESGWEPVIYTPENPEAPATDTSLLAEVPADIEVIKTPIWEPYTFYKQFVGIKKDNKINAGFLNENKKPGFAEKIAVWVRGNFFIPDARRFWIKPSIKFLTAYLRNHPVDVIVSTGPPHSMHLIALGIKRALNIPWLADFRDPWTGIDFYHQLRLSKYADLTHKRLENKVLANADRVTTVSNNCSKDLQKLYPREIEVITNGFDTDDFSTEAVSLDNKFTLTHIGSINQDRNPSFLWSTLREICEENSGFREDLELKFIGKTDITVIEYLEKTGLSANARKIEYLPHKEAVAEASGSQILMLLINNTPNVAGIVSGKIFEYLAAKRPILCIAPKDGDAAQIILDSEAGYVVDFNDNSALKAVILEWYSRYKNGTLSVQSKGTERYSRRSLTQAMACLLDSML